MVVRIGDMINGKAVVECNKIHINNPGDTDQIVDGYKLQGSSSCTPCDAPALIPLSVPDDGMIPLDSGTDPEGDWVSTASHPMPRDGRLVAFLIEQYVTNIPPNVEVVSSHPSLVIQDVEWLDYNSIQVWAEIAPDSAGTVVSLIIRDRDIPAKFVNLANYITIQGSAPVFVGISYKDPQTKDTPANPNTFVGDYIFTISGGRFDSLASVSSAIGTVGGLTVVDSETITGSIDYSAVIVPAIDTITITNPGQTPFTTTINVTGMQPVITGGQISSFAIGGPGGSASYNAPFFSVAPALVSMPPSVVTFSSITYVSPTLTFDYIIQPATPPGTVIYVEASDPGTGLSFIFPLCTAGLPGTFHNIVAAGAAPLPIAGREITVTAVGIGFGQDVFMSLSGLTWTGRDNTAGYIRDYFRTPVMVRATVTLDPSDIGAVVGVTVYAGLNPVVPRTDTFAAAFTVLAVPVLGFTLDTWSAGKNPGASGTLTIDGAGFTDQTGEISVTSTSDYISFNPATLVIVSSVQLTIDYTISDDANGQLAQQVTVGQSLDGSSVNFNTDLGNQAPVIDSVMFGGPQEVGRTMRAFIHGEYFDAVGGTVLAGGLVIVNAVISMTTTDAEVDITFAGVPGPFSLTVQNADLQTDVYNGLLLPEGTVEVYHGVSEFSDGKIYTGTPTTINIYGNNLDAPGIGFSMLPEAVIVGPVVSTRTHASIPVNVVGPQGSRLNVTATTLIGIYGPFYVGDIEAPPATVEVTGVSTTNLAESTNHPSYEIYGNNLNLLDPSKTVITFRIGTDTEKCPIADVPKGITNPVALNAWIQTPTKLTLDITLEPGLSPRWFSISLRDALSVELYNITSAFRATPFNSNVPVLHETLADVTANMTLGATYDMEVPVLSTPPFVVGDVMSVSGAVINVQTFDALALPYPVWRLNVTNGAVPGSYVEFRLSRPAFGGYPPCGAHYIPLGGVLT
jgi:hypothetical protein